MPLKRAMAMSAPTLPRHDTLFLLRRHVALVTMLPASFLRRHAI